MTPTPPPATVEQVARFATVMAQFTAKPGPRKTQRGAELIDHRSTTSTGPRR